MAGIRTRIRNEVTLDNASLQRVAGQISSQLRRSVTIDGRQFESVSRPLGKITGQADEFTKSLDASNARVLAFGASVAIINGVSQAFSQLLENTIRVEKKLADINVVLGGTTKELNQFKDAIFETAKNTAQSFDTVAEGALEFARQGLSMEESIKRINDALILTRLTGIDAATAVQGLTAAVNAFTKEGLTTSEIINKLAAVDTSFAVSSEDLINSLSRASSVANDAGVSFDELIAITAALQETTARGGAVIGNALKSIFTRIQRPATLSSLQELGIAVQDLEGNILPATKLLEGLAGKVDQLNDLQRSQIFGEVAGLFQINQLIAAVTDLGSANSRTAKAIQISTSATDEAFRKNEQLNDTLSALLSQTGTGIEQLFSRIGEIGLTDDLKTIVKGFSSVIEFFNKSLSEDEGNNIAKGFVKGIGGAFTSAPFLGLLAAIFAKLTVSFVEFGVKGLKSFLGLNKAAEQQKALQASILNILLQEPSILKQLEVSTLSRKDKENLLLQVLKQQTAEYQKIATLAASITPGLYRAGARTGPTGVTAPTSAGGYIPAFTKENRDIAMGVGGAKPSDKSVLIPNFSFGRGKKGPMVANTGEYIVPNYAMGGDAIFNRDMVDKMGMPNGAMKINAAGGYIPNFAKYTFESLKSEIGKRGVNSKIASALRSGDITSDQADQLLGTIRGISSAKQAEQLKTREQRELQKEADTFRDSRAIMIVPSQYGGQLIPQYGIYSKKRVGFNVAGYDSLEQAKGRLLNDEEIEKKLKDYSLGLAFREARKIGGGLKPEKRQEVSNKGALSAMAGSIFESAIQSILNAPQFENNNATFDFVGGKYAKELKKGLFPSIPSGIKYIDAKIRPSRENNESFAKKVLTVNNLISKKETEKSAALGYIPNFAKSDANPKKPKKTNNKAVLDATRYYGMLVGDFEGKRKKAKVYIKEKENGDLFSSINPPKDSDFVELKFPIFGLNKSGTEAKTGEKLKEEFTKIFYDETIALARSLTNNELPNPIKENEIKNTLNKGSAASAAGSVFESAIGSLLNDDDFKDFEQRTAGSLMDFTGQSLKNLKAKPNIFNIPKTSAKDGLEAKYTDSERLRLSVAEKIYKIKRQKKDAFSYKSNASSGYIPNFAMSPLDDAIARERAAGVPINQIRINQSGKLRNSQNPMGLAVTNTRDEPTGAIPNFAANPSNRPRPWNAGYRRADVVGAGFQWNAAGVAAYQQSLDKATKSTKDYTGAIFAVSLATNALSSAFADAESKIGKSLAAVTEGLAGLSNAAFLATGLREFGSQISQTKPELGEFVGAIGTYGAAIYAGYEVFKLGLNLWNNAITDNAKNLELASARASDAIDKFSLKINQYSREGQTEIKNQSAELIDRVSFSRGEQFGYYSNKLFSSKNFSVGLLGFGFDNFNIGITPNEIFKSQVQSKSGNYLLPNIFDENTLGQVQDVTTSALAQGLTEDQIETIITTFAEGRDLTSSNIDQLLTQITNAALDLDSRLESALSGLNIENIDPSERFSKIKEAYIKAGANERAAGQRASTKITQLNEAKRQADEEARTLRLNQARELIQLKLSSYIRGQLKDQKDANKNDLSRLRIASENLNLSEEQREAAKDQVAIIEQQLKAFEDLAKVVEDTLKGDAFITALGTDEAGIQKLKDNFDNILLIFGKTTDEADFFNKLSKAGITITKEASAILYQKLLTQREINSEEKTSLTNQQNENKQKRENNRLREDTLNKLNQQLDIQKRLAESQRDYNNFLVTNPLEQQKINLETQLANPTLDPSIRTQLQAQLDVINLQLSGIGIKQSSLQSLRSDIEGVLNPAIEFFKNNLREVVTFEGKETLVDPSADNSGIFNLPAFGSDYAKLSETRLLEVSKDIQKIFQGILDTELQNLLDGSISVDQLIEKIQNLIKVTKRSGEDEDSGLSTYETENLKLSKDEEQILRNKLNLGISIYQNEKDRLETERKRNAIVAREANLFNQGKAFQVGVERAKRNLYESSDTFYARIGQEIPESFANNLSQALVDASRGAKSLKEALLDAAQSFLATIQQAFMQRAVNQLVDMIPYGQSGGTEFASGGYVSGGSGVRDDVPAMLMAGEYVIKKDAVNKYGVGFLSNLNQKAMPTMQEGGFYLPGMYGQGSLKGKDLEAFVNQRRTSGQYDKIGAGGINLEAQSSRLTTFGLTREDNPMLQSIMEAQNQGMDLLIQKEQYEAQQEKAFKEGLKQLGIQALATVATYGLSQGIQAIGNKMALSKVSTQLSSYAENFGALDNLSDIGKSYLKLAPDNRKLFADLINNQKFDAARSLLVGGTAKPITSSWKGANGGSSQSSANSMIMGGEFVMGRQAVQQYGKNYFDSINNMTAPAPRFAQGGLVGSDQQTSSVGRGGDTNITINVSSSGDSKTQSDSQSGNSQESDMTLAEKIKKEVVRVIEEEKRVSGSLSSRRRGV